VSSPRPPDKSTCTEYSRLEVDHVRQIVDTWCMMVSLIDQVMTDEHRGLPTVISPTQEQLMETGSDKLPSLPWDLGVHFVSRIFYIMLTQVGPESHTFHLGLVWSGPAGTCPMGQDLFSLVIIMIGNGYVWMGTSSTKMSLLIQFLDNKSNGHRYFSWRTQERRIQDVCRGQTFIVRLVQG
jgi:hypothetical protein